MVFGPVVFGPAVVGPVVVGPARDSSGLSVLVSSCPFSSLTAEPRFPRFALDRTAERLIRADELDQGPNPEPGRALAVVAPILLGADRSRDVEMGQGAFPTNSWSKSAAESAPA